MNVITLRPLAQAQADAMNYGIGFSLGEKRIDPHDVYLQAEAPKLLAPGTVHTVDGFVALGTVADTVASIAEQLQARRKRAQQDEIERLYRELTESDAASAKGETWPLATWPFPAPAAPPAVPAALPSTPSAEPERPHIPIDEMTLADYRRGIANVWRSYHGA